MKSYTVEAEFLASEACSQLVAAGIPVARAYSVQREICRSDQQQLILRSLTFTIPSGLIP